MSFDQPTRNLLAKTVEECRKLLLEDYEDQLSRVYGMHADGLLRPVETLTQLDQAGREIAAALREQLAHFAATTAGREAERTTAAYQRLVQELGFTTLNRLAALRMCEERGLIAESVRRGRSSEGYQLFAQIGGGALGEPHASYRLYLELLFDELAVDLGVLFDRSHPTSFLFPSESCLEKLLAQVNKPEVSGLWAEDETIGWVYQYWNSAAERKKMREASQAPRNSRELAVRNQFFTPRYVVEFLTDNTLGRTWYEMQVGQTRLRDDCRYLVRRPDEVFLSQVTVHWPGYNDATEAAARLLQEGDEESFPEFVARDEADQRLVEFAHVVDGYQRHPLDGDHVAFELWRQELDARAVAGDFDGLTTQELLDALFLHARAHRLGGAYSSFHVEAPAAVPLVNEVRRRALAGRRPEATQEELLRAPVFIPYRAKKDPRELRVLDPACGSGHFLLYAFDLLLTIYDEAYDDPHLGEALRADYPEREAYRRAVPGLIMARNLHGIDIDPRACQIAALALWLRAQRAYKEMGLKPAERPTITRSNIVCAEPMPGERGMLEEFLETVDARLRPLVRTIWEKMQLAGELGSLLKIEKEIAAAIETARRESLVDLPPVQMTLHQRGRPAQQSVMSFATAEEVSFWERAEEQLLEALEAYAASVTGDGLGRRLFAEDAAMKFAFLDVSCKRVDVVLMNPPFGAISSSAKASLDQLYPRTRNDMYAAFVERGISFLYPFGLIGAITSRTGLFLSSFQKWREEILLKEAPPLVLADLGYGVLDGAMVEVAAYCLRRR